MGLMARVRVPASVGLRANRRTPARPKSSQQEQDDRLPPDRRLDPENSLNTLDPAYFEPPPSVDRQ